MKKRTVKDLMVPLSEYATISETASLADAILALERSQKQFDPSRYRHRAILVVDDQGRVSGKIDQIDLLKALEPKYEELQSRLGMAHLVFTKKFMQSMLTSYNLWEKPMEEICRKGAERKVKDFMYIPSEAEYIEENASLDVAIHLLVAQRFQSLLVTREEQVVGILRLTDIFTEMVNAVKACRIQDQ
jgi:CBS domain-containing protein